MKQEILIVSPDEDEERPCIVADCVDEKGSRMGPDGARTLCPKCFQKYLYGTLPLFVGVAGLASAAKSEGSEAVYAYGFASAEKRDLRHPVIMRLEERDDLLILRHKRKTRRESQSVQKKAKSVLSDRTGQPEQNVNKATVLEEPKLVDEPKQLQTPQPLDKAQPLDDPQPLEKAQPPDELQPVDISQPLDEPQPLVGACPIPPKTTVNEKATEDSLKNTKRTSESAEPEQSSALSSPGSVQLDGVVQQNLVSDPNHAKADGNEVIVIDDDGDDGIASGAGPENSELGRGMKFMKPEPSLVGETSVGLSSLLTLNSKNFPARVSYRGVIREMEIPLHVDIYYVELLMQKEFPRQDFIITYKNENGESVSLMEEGIHDFFNQGKRMVNEKMVIKLR